MIHLRGFFTPAFGVLFRLLGIGRPCSGVGGGSNLQFLELPLQRLKRRDSCPCHSGGDVYAQNGHAENDELIHHFYVTVHVALRHQRLNAHRHRASLFRKLPDLLAKLAAVPLPKRPASHDPCISISLDYPNILLVFGEAADDSFRVRAREVSTRLPGLRVHGLPEVMAVAHDLPAHDVGGKQRLPKEEGGHLVVYGVAPVVSVITSRKHPDFDIVEEVVLLLEQPDFPLDLAIAFHCFSLPPHNGLPLCDIMLTH